jgi:hypothetical protein
LGLRLGFVLIFVMDDADENSLLIAHPAANACARGGPGRQPRILLATLLLVSFCSAVCYSLIAPFFPELVSF